MHTRKIDKDIHEQREPHVSIFHAFREVRNQTVPAPWQDAVPDYRVACIQESRLLVFQTWKLSFSVQVVASSLPLKLFRSLPGPRFGHHFPGEKVAETQQPESKERPGWSIFGVPPPHPCFATVFLFSWLQAGTFQLSR